MRVLAHEVDGDIAFELAFSIGLFVYDWVDGVGRLVYI